MILYSLYQIVVTFFVLLVFPFVFLVNRVQKGEAPGLAKRLGIGLQFPPKKAKSLRIWIHAASVGEVQAARVLIHELTSRREDLEFCLSTMTQYGQEVAVNQLPKDIPCFLAPLDAGVVVRKFLSVVKPDMYICMETELWPAIFIELSKCNVPSFVLNGRMTTRSLDRYKKIQGLMNRVLGNLAGIGVIGTRDAAHFRALGVAPEVLRETGNIKYDYPEENAQEIRQKTRKSLQVENETVFICGSTRTGEEEKLLKVFSGLQEQLHRELIWVIAPRHIERMEEVKRTIVKAGLSFDLYSELKQKERSSNTVLVDTMGDLSTLYGAGDLIFVGGSLVNKGGHNIMEAARFGKPVFYGPFMNDFKDAAEILENAGGGFRVKNEDELSVILSDFYQNKNKYTEAGAKAAHAVASQRGAAKRQGDIVMEHLSFQQANC